MNSLFQPDKPDREHMTDLTQSWGISMRNKTHAHLCHAKIHSQLAQLIWSTLSVLTCQEEQQPTENKFCAVSSLNHTTALGKTSERLFQMETAMMDISEVQQI